MDLRPDREDPLDSSCVHWRCSWLFVEFGVLIWLTVKEKRDGEVRFLSILKSELNLNQAMLLQTSLGK